MEKGEYGNEEPLLPTGMEFHECIRDVPINEARCRIAECDMYSSLSSHTIFFNANDLIVTERLHVHMPL